MFAFKSPAAGPLRPEALAAASNPPDQATGRANHPRPPGAPSRPGAPPGDAGKPGAAAAGPETVPAAPSRGGRGRYDAGALPPRVSVPVELPGHIILKFAVGGGQQGLKIGGGQASPVAYRGRCRLDRKPRSRGREGTFSPPADPRGRPPWNFERQSRPGPPAAGWPGGAPPRAGSSTARAAANCRCQPPPCFKR